MIVPLRSQVLSLYREMLWLSRNMSGDAAYRRNAAREIRDEFQRNKHIQDEERIVVLMERARGKLGYMRMQTPKYLLHRFKTNEQELLPRKHFVAAEGQVLEGSSPERGKAISNWREGNVDPDSLAKHQYLLRRMRFEEGPLKNYQSSVPWLRNHNPS